MNVARMVLLLASMALPCSLGCDGSVSLVTGTAPVLPPGNYDDSARSRGGLRDITFDDIKFEMELDEQFQRTMLNSKTEDYFGHKIRIRGYMYPTLRKRGLTHFVLVRDNLECCFGPGAALFDCILVHMQPGKTAEYSIRPVAVEGKFSFEEYLDPDGVVRAIYRLDGEEVTL